MCAKFFFLNPPGELVGYWCSIGKLYENRLEIRGDLAKAFIAGNLQNFADRNPWLMSLADILYYYIEGKPGLVNHSIAVVCFVFLTPCLQAKAPV